MSNAIQKLRNIECILLRSNGNIGRGASFAAGTTLTIAKDGIYDDQNAD